MRAYVSRGPGNEGYMNYTLKIRKTGPSKGQRDAKLREKRTDAREFTMDCSGSSIDKDDCVNDFTLL